MISFILNGYLWRVIFVPPTYPKLLNQQGQFTLGCCDGKENVIYISEALTESKSLKVLCHEITHAAMFSYGVQLTHDQEELLADIISTYGNEIISVTNKVFWKIKNGGRY